MASSQQYMVSCVNCKKSTMKIRTIIKTILHIFLMFCTLGFWFIIWLLFIWKGTPQCTVCGKDNGILDQFNDHMDDKK